MQITNEILLSFIYCPYKAYRKCKSESGEISDYEKLSSELKHSQKLLFSETLSSAKNLIRTQAVGDNFTYNKGTILDSKFSNSNAEITPDGIEFIGKNKAIPILLTPFEKITKTDKLFVALQASYLQNEFSFQIENCKIIFGKNAKQTKFRLSSFSKAIRKNIIELNKILLQSHPPTFYRNNHCHVCEFHNSCLEKLKERDDLSLLTGLKPKEILQKNNRGIFSVRQLSYTFRPKKNPYRKRKFLPELKALAIREGKTFIQEIPNIATSPNEIFLDIEGIPDRNFYYLIGVIIRANGLEKTYSFWANNENEEEEIFIEFFTLLQSLSEFTIYHYGSYEIQALKKISKTLSSEYQEFVKKIIDNSFNIVIVFTNNIYPPTYSNSLKEIARFLKFDWSEKDASGIQSIVWRCHWEMTQNDDLKHKLIQYNIEDCLALKRVTEFLKNLTKENQKYISEKEIIDVKDISNDRKKFGVIKFRIDDLDYINKRAYFEYQKNKIYFRSDKNFKRIKRRQIKQMDRYNNIDKKIIIPSPLICLHCDSRDIRNGNKRNRTVIDLKFLKNGIKKCIIRYGTYYSFCKKCSKTSLTETFLTKAHYKYGHTLRVWLIYQTICNAQSHGQIQRSLKDIFKIYIDRATIYREKSTIIKTYEETYHLILKRILTGQVIYIDETKVKLKDGSGYIWVLTNRHEVYFLFKDSREGEFLRELLKDYKGVLVSDFYSAYDSLDCPQQKCLIHLVRDLNTDLEQNVLNSEFNELAHTFSTLLKIIVSTIDQYGLKKRHLKKHNRDVDRFFNMLNKQEFVTEISQQYIKRFEKNREKLFAFLNYDNVSWNNNSVEHVIKYFAIYRNSENGHFSKNGLNNYLTLLSIYHTCQYMEINFLDFLKSGEKNIFELSEKTK